MTCGTDIVSIIQRHLIQTLVNDDSCDTDVVHHCRERCEGYRDCLAKFETYVSQGMFLDIGHVIDEEVIGEFLPSVFIQLVRLASRGPTDTAESLAW